MAILKTGLMPSKKKGKVIPNGVSLQAHEFKTVIYFTERGFDVELIPPSGSPRNKKPDIIMSGLMWEMKAPKGEGKNNIDNVFKKATHQSENIIVDFRRYKVNKVDKAMHDLEKRFKVSRRVRRLCIITHEGKLIYMPKKSALYNKYCYQS